MKVVKMTASRHVADRWYCQLENGEILKVNTALIADYSLYTGRELDAAQLDGLRAAAGQYAARQKALRMSGSRALSRRELERKLQDKGVEAQCAAETVDWMERIGAVNDAEYAAMVVRHYAAAGYGRGRIRDELCRRGISRDLWDDAFTHMPEQSEKLDHLLARKLQGVRPDDQKQIKKVTDMLLRRGFSWGEIRDALARHAFELDGYEEI